MGRYYFELVVDGIEGRSQLELPIFFNEINDAVRSHARGLAAMANATVWIRDREGYPFSVAESFKPNS